MDVESPGPMALGVEAAGLEDGRHGLEGMDLDVGEGLAGPDAEQADVRADVEDDGSLLELDLVVEVASDVVVQDAGLGAPNAVDFRPVRESRGSHEIPSKPILHGLHPIR